MAPSASLRRNGTPSSKFETKDSRILASPTPSTSSWSSALLPTPTESILLAIYPATLLLGSLFSLLDPLARNAPYNPSTQSHPPDRAPSYFALKRNLFNAYFVKVDWFWVTLAYILFLFLHNLNGPPGLVLTPRRLRGLVRYGVVTAWWAAFTQWFFGPALIDRGFTITGGACELAEHFEGQGGKRELVSGQACKIAGGQWKGGHDISGHVFILTLGGAFLGMEILPVLLQRLALKDERIVKRKDGSTDGIDTVGMSKDDARDANESLMLQIGKWAPRVVIGLNWFMLFTTAAYFHTWFEKLSGLLVASSALFTVFFLPRVIPAMREVVGMPGV